MPSGSAGVLAANDPHPDAGGAKSAANAGTFAPVAPDPPPLPPLPLAPQPAAKAADAASVTVQPKTLIALLQLRCVGPSVNRRRTRSQVRVRIFPEVSFCFGSL